MGLRIHPNSYLRPTIYSRRPSMLHHVLKPGFRTTFCVAMGRIRVVMPT
jgi:hypothetical protein